MNPYVHNVDLYIILEDGWSRGFTISQIQQECSMMGYFLKHADIEKFIKLFEHRYELDTKYLNAVSR